MIGRTVKTLVLTLVAVCALGSVSEAAQKRVVRHRVRHSTRVVSLDVTDATPGRSAKNTKTKKAAVVRGSASTTRPRTTTKPR